LARKRERERERERERVDERESADSSESGRERRDEKSFTHLLPLSCALEKKKRNAFDPFRLH